MVNAPQPNIDFHARIDLDTEKRRRWLQAQTGLSAPALVREAFLALERRFRRRNAGGHQVVRQLELFTDVAADRERGDEPC
jgi:hypothetical protein